MFISGCRDAGEAGKRLQRQSAALAGDYISDAFKHVRKQNPHSYVYRTAPEKLLLAADDGVEVFESSSGHEELIRYSAARFYNALELEMQIISAVPGGISAIDHKNYTFRSLLEINIREIRRVWHHVPGAMVSSVWLKESPESEKYKHQLQTSARNILPSRGEDMKMIYRQKNREETRDLTISVFVLYDPDLPGWVLEDIEPGLPAIPEKAPEWLAEKLFAAPLPDGVSIYKDQLFWKNVQFQKNYDDNLVLRSGQWIKKVTAVDNERLANQLKLLDIQNCSRESLTAFLRNLESLHEEVDRQKAYEKILSGVDNLLRKLDDDNDYYKIVELQNVLLDDPVWQPLSGELVKRFTNIKSLVGARINLQLSDQLARIDNARNSIVECINDPQCSAWKLNVVLTRNQSVLLTLCTEKNTDLQQELALLHLAWLLEHEQWEAIKDLYASMGRADELKKRTYSVLVKCSQCRNGRQSCRNCSELPGKCEMCKGQRFIDEDICRTCQGFGVCRSCQGQGKALCLSCNGRAFRINKNEAGKLLQESLRNFEHLLQLNKDVISEKIINKLSGV